MLLKGPDFQEPPTGESRNPISSRQRISDAIRKILVSDLCTLKSVGADYLKP
jgi:hypothetical protein